MPFLCNLWLWSVIVLEADTIQDIIILKCTRTTAWTRGLHLPPLECLEPTQAVSGVLLASPCLRCPWWSWWGDVLLVLLMIIGDHEEVVALALVVMIKIDDQDEEDSDDLNNFELFWSLETITCSSLLRSALVSVPLGARVTYMPSALMDRSTSKWTWEKLYPWWLFFEQYQHYYFNALPSN